MLRKISICVGLIVLTACTTTVTKQESNSTIKYQGRLDDPIMVIALLSEQQHQWAGTPYLIGGNTRKGIDCSAFVQKTFKDRFGVRLPRTTVEQAKQGTKIKKTELQTGDLVFFRTGRGTNGYHVGIYVKNDQFLHASTKGGVIYSSLNSPYWKRTYWQARRL